MTGQNVGLTPRVTEVAPRTLPDGKMSKADARQQLFNLATDPGEQFNLSDSPEYTQQVQMLRKLMFRFIQINMNTEPGLVVTKAAVDRETVARLESLGYVGSTDEDEEPNEPNEPEPESRPASPPGSAPATGPAQPGPVSP